jgi:hypothetical protein
LSGPASRLGSWSIGRLGSGSISRLGRRLQRGSTGGLGSCGPLGWSSRHRTKGRRFHILFHRIILKGSILFGYSFSLNHVQYWRSIILRSPNCTHSMHTTDTCSCCRGTKHPGRMNGILVPWQSRPNKQSAAGHLRIHMNIPSHQHSQ